MPTDPYSENVFHIYWTCPVPTMKECELQVQNRVSKHRVISSVWLIVKPCGCSQKPPAHQVMLEAFWPPALSSSFQPHVEKSSETPRPAQPQQSRLHLQPRSQWKCVTVIVSGSPGDFNPKGLRGKWTVTSTWTQIFSHQSIENCWWNVTELNWDEQQLELLSFSIDSQRDLWFLM